MPSFSVSKPVGADRKIAPRDTLALKSAIQRLGFYDPPEWGLTDVADMAMIDGLIRFQSKTDFRGRGHETRLPHGTAP